MNLRTRFWIVLATASVCSCVWAQDQKPVTPAQTPTNQTPTKTPAQPATDESGPNTDTTIILPKKKEEEAPPPAPAEEKVKNPDGQIFSLRVDVPIVNMDVNVLLDKTHQFVPGLKPENFLVVEDGVEQQVQTVRVTKTPITAVMLLEFASTSYPFLQDMMNASASFFRTLQPEDYIAVATYDIRTHILCDFTNSRDTVREALQSLIIPTFSETNEFDALYETLWTSTNTQYDNYTDTTRWAYYRARLVSQSGGGALTVTVKR